MTDLKKPLIKIHETAEDFLDRFQSYRVASSPINHNVLQVATALRNDHAIYEPPFWFCTIEDAGAVVGAAVYAVPDGLVVTDLDAQGLRIIANHFLSELPVPERIIAEPSIAQELVACVSQRFGSRMVSSTGWRVAQLTAVDRPAVSARGRLREARPSDRDLVVSWGADYGKEKSAFLDVARFMSTKLNAGELYVWEDDVPTTIVSVSTATRYGARVSSVYTPPRHRGFGYATSAVSEVCSNLLDSGCGYIVLTWRIGDPAGRIYQRLGFRIIGTHQSYVQSERKIA